MNAKELYLNICQVVSAGEAAPMTWPNDYDREAVVHVSRSSNGNNISHITVEFAGIRAKFLSCLIFDGTGDYGTGVHNFAMPRIRTTVQQKALGCLSVLNYLTANGYIKADFEFFRDKIVADLNGGVGDTLIKYDQMCKLSKLHIERQKESASIAA